MFGDLYAAVAGPTSTQEHVRLLDFVEGAPIRSGEILGAGESAGATVTGFGGPLGALDGARATFINASDAFIDAGKPWKPNPVLGYNEHAPIELPSKAMEAAEKRTLREASALLDAAGVKHTVNRKTNTIEILPDDGTMLGRYAELLGALGSRLIYCPAMLWSQCCQAMLNARGFLFLSNEAITALKPGAPEAHETIHAWLRHILHDLGEPHPYMAQLMPTAGRTLFGEGFDYSRGFTMEELLTTACDLVEETKSNVFAVWQHATKLDRGKLPRATAEACRRFAPLANTALSFSAGWSSYYTDTTSLVKDAAGLDVNPARRVLVAHTTPFSVELTTYHLSGATTRRVVAALLVDPEDGRQMEVPILDEGALASVDAALAGEPADLFGVVRDHVAPHLEQLRAIAERQAAAYERLHVDPADGRALAALIE